MKPYKLKQVKEYRQFPGYKRFCKRCGNIFSTTCRHGKVCNNCNLSLKAYNDRLQRKAKESQTR